MNEMVRWQSGATDLRCRVCDFHGAGAHVADVTVPGRTDARAIRCPRCGSVELLEDNMGSSPDDASVDGYVEAGAGIEAIAGSLAQVEPSTVRRFLDVGCNYGFALDVGRFLHGWEVVGVEPSYAGRRGAEELGLEILNVYLSDDADVGEAFDLILASEVLEHVPDPLAFLEMLGRRLTPRGSIILTTPAAEIVQPDEPLGEVLVALSPGFHIFLASAAGLEQLLRRAGFTAVQVTRARGALKAAASFDPGARFRGSEAVDDIVLEPYYSSRADMAPEGSSLASGMATRHLRLLVSRGMWEESDASAERAIATMRSRHGLDLHDPAGVQAIITEKRDVPWNMHGLAFALGMKAMLQDLQPARAAEYFELVIASTGIWQSHAQILDPDTADLRFQARVQLANALVDSQPETAARLAGELSQHRDAADPATAALLAYRQSRVFVDLVVKGHLEAGSELRERVVENAPHLVASADPEHVAAGLDSMYALGMLHLLADDPDTAVHWFSQCVESAEATGNEHAIAEAAAEHITICRERVDMAMMQPVEARTLQGSAD